MAELKQARRGNPVERGVERMIFASRWLLAPIYLGLVASLGILVYTFFKELIEQVPLIPSMDEADIILLVLTLVDLSLAGNLVLIVMFSGYENFVSRLDAAGDEERLGWMGTLDFSGLKTKLATSIVAISAIHLLKVFMNLKDYTQGELLWFTLIHLTFVASGLCFAFMDFVYSRSYATRRNEE
ncbi:MAG: TIGR00645 family protein [Hydrogenophilaceae bacterium]|jgi:uncharacterized protein (TIGR00645 family)|nr:TIGR00645 family protein [Hydrogenophilaceae bacterium]